MLAREVVALELTLREGDGSIDARPASRSLPKVRGAARVDQFILFGDVNDLLVARTELLFIVVHRGLSVFPRLYSTGINGNLVGHINGPEL